MTMVKAPGKSERDGISLLELAQMFPDEDAARSWFEAVTWPDGTRYCPRCGTDNNYECSHAKMPYRCRDCRRYFSVKTGTPMEGSPIPLLKWLYAIYLDATSLKGVSSMKLHRDLNVSQKTAWFMQQRIREAFRDEGPTVLLQGPVEIDETFVGGKRRNMHAKERRKLKGRGTVGKTPVVGIKDRETNHVFTKVVRNTDTETLQGFVLERVVADTRIFTDDLPSYGGLPNHQAVNHSTGQYVAGDCHTQGIESFWSILKRAYHGTFHKISPKHLQRYVDEFAGRHNIRELDTLEQMEVIVEGLAGKRLPYLDLIAPTSRSSGARPCRFV